MSDVDSDDSTERLCSYGTALPAYEPDQIPSKKPITVEDMVATDEYGRRRFHGAFTGGFSAGFWNTVGSLEGFKPNEFKSSRSEKAAVKKMTPQDFMDEEDLGEFGIAPQKIQTKPDFAPTTSGKRKLEAKSDGPIPGEPVLQNLLKVTHDPAAVRILKKMGWREGQGIGSRLTYKEKKKTKQRNEKETYVMKRYGCDLGPMTSATQRNSENEDDDSTESDLSDCEITFAPDDFDPYIATIKENTFGIGYSGLSKSGISGQHVELFKPFQMVDKNNKKLSITGQGFGIGALEEDDDIDIYAQDDLKNYDMSLDDGKQKERRKAIEYVEDSSIIEGFARAQINDTQAKVFTVDVPRNFKPRNWSTRRSRFEPIDENRQKQLEEQNRHKLLGLGRHDLKPEERGAILNDSSATQKKIEQTAEKQQELRKQQEKQAKTLFLNKQFVSENNEEFRPFAGNPEKQERYEKFLEFKETSEAAIDKFLNGMQPLNMSNFDRELEKKEFMQAKRMYKPLDSLMANRFIKEVDIKKEESNNVKIDETGKKIIKVIRTKTMWKPHKDLCKRFNVPEPYGGMMFDEEAEKKKKKKSSSLFDFIGVPLNTKTNFVTPQVIPKSSREPLDNKKRFTDAVEKEREKLSAKEFFNSDDSNLKGKETEIKNVPNSSTDNQVPSTRSSTSRWDQMSKKSTENKTELEIRVMESRDKKPEEKKDLFKAIFCDSEDDEEQEDEDNATKKVNEKDSEKTESQLTENQKSKFIESFLNTKSATEINVLRNTSPPRGLFKNLLGESSLVVPEKPKEINNTVVIEKQSNEKPTVTTIEKKCELDDLDQKLLKKLKSKDLKKLLKEKDESKKKKHKHKEKHHKKEKKHKKDKKHKKSKK